MEESVTTCKVTVAKGADTEASRKDKITRNAKRLATEVIKDFTKISEDNFKDKITQIEEFLGDSITDSLPESDQTKKIIRRIEDFQNRTTKERSLSLKKDGIRQTLKDEKEDFSMTYMKGPTEHEDSPLIRFEGKLNNKNINLSYRIKENLIQINRKRYSLSDEQGNTMLNAISQIIENIREHYKDKLILKI